MDPLEQRGHRGCKALREPWEQRDRRGTKVQLEQLDHRDRKGLRVTWDPQGQLVQQALLGHTQQGLQQRARKLCCRAQ